jgi:hypothetical protein
MMTPASIEAEEESARKKTLGQLLHELRRRTEIAADFDETLSSFLEHRNEFVHGLLMRSEYDSSDPDGRERLRAFMGRLMGEAWSVIQVLTVAQLNFVDALGARINHKFLEPQTSEERELIQWLRARSPEFESMLPQRR